MSAKNRPRRGRKSDAIPWTDAELLSQAVAVLHGVERLTSGEAGVLALDARLAARWGRSAALVRRLRSSSAVVREMDPELYRIIERELDAATKRPEDTPLRRCAVSVWLRWVRVALVPQRERANFGQAWLAHVAAVCGVGEDDHQQLYGDFTAHAQFIAGHDPAILFGPKRVTTVKVYSPRHWVRRPPREEAGETFLQPFVSVPEFRRVGRKFIADAKQLPFPSNELRLRARLALHEIAAAARRVEPASPWTPARPPVEWPPRLLGEFLRGEAAVQLSRLRALAAPEVATVTPRPQLGRSRVGGLKSGRPILSGLQV